MGLVIIGLISIGQPDYSLAVIIKMLLGNDGPVGDNVIHATRAHRSGVTEKIDLDGCSPPGQDAKAVVARQSGQIDDDVNLMMADRCRDIRVIPFTHLNEIVKRGFDPPAQFRTIIWAKRYRHSFEPRLVMHFEQTDRYLPNRMIAKVG